VAAHDLVTSFENVIDGVFNDTVGVLQDVQREVTSLINSPIEILKDAFETMASNRVDNAFSYIEDQVESLREVLE
jgi:phage-related protein